MKKDNENQTGSKHHSAKPTHKAHPVTPLSSTPKDKAVAQVLHMKDYKPSAHTQSEPLYNHSLHRVYMASPREHAPYRYSPDKVNADKKINMQVIENQLLLVSVFLGLLLTLAICLHSVQVHPKSSLATSSSVSPNTEMSHNGQKPTRPSELVDKKQVTIPWLR